VITSLWSGGNHSDVWLQRSGMEALSFVYNYYEVPNAQYVESF